MRLYTFIVRSVYSTHIVGILCLQVRVSSLKQLFKVFVVCVCSLNFVKRIELWLMSVHYKHQNIHLNLKLKFISFVEKNARYLINW